MIVIISILLGFILNAGIQARRSAEQRQTQALITKLELALNDRLDALLQTRPVPNPAHLALAAIYNSGSLQQYGPMPGYLRAQVIAYYDYIKSEMPDVFFVQNDPNYPINFAGNPYPTAGGASLPNYILPLGNALEAYTSGPFSTGTSNPAGTGVYGASYAAAAGIYKGLGYLPQGFDGVDNNSNGLIDEYAEGVNSTNQATVQTHLSNHTHNTARAEVLYAILVEGRGPLGSVFNKDDFTDREVQDTDQDGLPEFVDAWGNPLQFFRWPLLYHSDIQRGAFTVPTSENSWSLFAPYESPAVPANQQTINALMEREQDPLDVNQQLMAPAWWSSSYNNASPYALATPAGNAGASAGAQAFEFYFHRLTEPFPSPGGPNFWDRGGTYGGRRAFYSKFLVVSGGLDGQLGVFIYSDADIKHMGNGAAPYLIANENLALPFSVGTPLNGVRTGMDLGDFTTNLSYTTTSIAYNTSSDPTNPSSSDLLQAAQDDISNQNMQSSVAIGGSK